LKADDEWEIYMRETLFRREGEGDHYIAGSFPEWSDVVARRTCFV